jgi:hypothetical protein
MIRPSTVVYVPPPRISLSLFLLKGRDQTADIELTAEPVQKSRKRISSRRKKVPDQYRIESKTGGLWVRDAEEFWALTEPVEAKADQAAAEAAASQVTAMRILDTIPNVDFKIVGLENPEYVLTVKFTSGGERTVDIGVITPTESGYYVRDAEGEVVIVSRDAIEPLIGL